MNGVTNLKDSKFVVMSRKNGFDTCINGVLTSEFNQFYTPYVFYQWTEYQLTENVGLQMCRETSLILTGLIEMSTQGTVRLSKYFCHHWCL